MTQRTILFAFDCSHESLEGLKRTAAWARVTGHKLLVTHIVETSEPTFALDETARDLLERAVGSLESPNLAIATRIEVADDAPAALCQIAETEGADLLVITTEPAGFVDRVLFGSMAEAVVVESSRPVLVLHPGDRLTFSGRTLLPVALDGHDGNAVRIARHWLEPASQVQLLHVVAPLAFPAAGMAQGGAVAPATLQPPSAEEILRAASPLEGRCAGLQAFHTVGNPAAGILGHARDNRTDLIVMGSAGAKGLERFFLGSVAGYVLRQASCPVLVVPNGPENARTARFRTPQEVAESPLPNDERRRILEQWHLDELQKSRATAEGMQAKHGKPSALEAVEKALRSVGT